MILWVFIEFFGVKIVITDILPIFTDIFSEISAQARVLYSRDFSVEKWVFSDFSAKNRRFYRFSPDFSSDQFSLCFFFSVPAENRFFGDISTEKKIFCSLSILDISRWLHKMSVKWFLLRVGFF